MFNFVKIKPDNKTRTLKVTCCNCNEVVYIDTAWANVIDKPYRSYYCDSCRNEIVFNITRNRSSQ